jgi:hypothetical protein
LPLLSTDFKKKSIVIPLVDLSAADGADLRRAYFGITFLFIFAGRVSIMLDGFPIGLYGAKNYINPIVASPHLNERNRVIFSIVTGKEIAWLQV